MIKGVHYAVGEPVTAIVVLSDFGKSPAIHDISANQVFFGPDALRQVDSFFDAQPKSRPKKPRGESTIPPSGGVCPSKPEGPDDTTVFNCAVIAAQSTSPLQSLDQASGDGEVVIVGHHTYQDIAGNEYVSDYCFYTFATGAIASCASHNDVQ